MNLLEFIPYLKNIEKIDVFISEKYPEVNIEDADIYMENLSIESKMFFVDPEITGDKLEFLYKGQLVINLFPLAYLIEVFEGCYNENMTDKEIAEAIMYYRINDAWQDSN